ncbi:unnamed protein product, partial [Effrenium voratum]
EVRRAALMALRRRDGKELAPFAEQVLPLVADPASEVRQIALDVVSKMNCDELRSSVAQRCTAQPFRPFRPSRPLSAPSRRRQCPEVPAFDAPDAGLRDNPLMAGGVGGFGLGPGSPGSLDGGFWDTDDGGVRSTGFEGDSTPERPATPDATPRFGAGNAFFELPRESSPRGSGGQGRRWQSPHVCTAPRRHSETMRALEQYLSFEPDFHWRVRDTMAFNPKPMQGDALALLLSDNDWKVREGALLMMRRLVPIYWVQHADTVAGMLRDRTPEVRMAACVALFHLDPSDLEYQAHRVVVALKDELWPVREAALLALRKLRPSQLRVWAHEALRCKLDESLRVRCAAQRVLERLAPNVLADLACRGARGMFEYLHPLRGSDDTFTVKALAIGNNLAVHAESSSAGADLLSVTLTVDKENMDNEPVSVAARAKEWQERVAAGISQRLLSRQNSTAVLGRALEAATVASLAGCVDGAGWSGMTGSTPRTPLPWKSLAVLCCICLIDCINATILNPYVDDMVSRLLHTSRGSPEVAMWVSVLVGSYSICEVAFSAMWGMLADRVGRRPVLLVGLAGSAVAPLIFGLADSLAVALFARILDGFFCGNVGVARTYLGELVDSSNEAQAFGILSSTFSLGLFIGPMLGGLLAYPGRWQLFAGTVFDTHPFFLANLSYALLAVAAFFLGLAALPESRQIQRDPLLGAGAARSTWQGFPRTPHLRKLLVASSLLLGYVSSRLNAFVLVSSLPRDLNGLALTPHQFGYIQVIAACMILLTQLTVYPVLVRKCGPHKGYAVAIAWTVLLTLPMPAYYLVADPDRYHFWRYVPVTLWQGLSQIGFSSAFPLSIMLVNRECSAENRGSINGWCNSLNALSRGLGPVISGSLVSLGCAAERELPGGRYLAFYVSLLLGLAPRSTKRV